MPFKKLYLICLVYICGCVQETPRSNLIGLSETQLVVIKGPPNYREKISSLRSYLQFKDEDGVQIENNRAIAAFQKPTDSEKSVNYWKQDWKRDESEVTFLGEDRGFQIVNKTKHTIIVVPAGTEEVTRVVTYE